MLTPRQKEVLHWIKDFIETHDVAPTYEEIREGLGLKSLNTVAYHVRRLSESGHVQTPFGNRKRAISTPGSPGGLLLLGEVRAGHPVESYEDAEEIDLPRGFYGGRGEHFALRVRGESMIDEGIMDGDVIVVRRTRSCENSRVVVAQVDGEATVKRYRRRGALIELIPANPDFEPIVVDEERVSILGVVVALFRKY